IIINWTTLMAPATFMDNEEHFNATLSKLLKPRFHGSPGHGQARAFIVRELRDLGFFVAQNKFRDGENYTNIVGFWNVESERFLVLSCHYDSQSPGWGQNETSFGAIDGAVSCAILLNLAKTMGEYFKGNLSQRMDIGMALVFFDGHKPLPMGPENATRLIGSRHFIEMDMVPTESIVLLMTLNLIGSANETYFSFYKDTDELHFQITDIEQELWESKQLDDGPVLFHKVKHHESCLPDDHIPFHAKGTCVFFYSFLIVWYHSLGVPVLHISPEKYPKVHGTTDDNAANLDWPTIRNMIKILRTFLHKYLESQEFEMSSESFVFQHNDD
ncbi:hypothetical protein KR018_010546, partial [Drosophila ironensis]